MLRLDIGYAFIAACCLECDACNHVQGVGSRYFIPESIFKIHPDSAIEMILDLRHKIGRIIRLRLHRGIIAPVGIRNLMTAGINGRAVTDAIGAIPCVYLGRRWNIHARISRPAFLP